MWSHNPCVNFHDPVGNDEPMTLGADVLALSRYATTAVEGQLAGCAFGSCIQQQGGDAINISIGSMNFHFVGRYFTLNITTLLMRQQTSTSMKEKWEDLETTK